MSDSSQVSPERAPAALRGLELRHLRYFDAVARELHFGRAAQRLAMSQPPLSVQIRRLETLLGVRLFERDTTHVSLTAAGERLRDDLRELFARLNDTIERVRRTGAGLGGTLRLGFVTPATYGVMPQALAAYRARFPGVELVLREMTTDAQVEALLDGTIDVGLVLPPVAARGLVYRPLQREPLVVAIAAADPLARDAGPLALSSLAEQPLILFPRRHAPQLHDDIIAACRAGGFTPRPGQQAVEMQTIVSLVAAGMGFAIVPASVSRLARPGVAYREIAGGSAEVELGLAWQARRESPIIARFVETMVQGTNE